jgi:hypothetical protein
MRNRKRELGSRDFDAQVRESLLRWRESRGHQERLRQLARQDPSGVVGPLFVYVGTMRDLGKLLYEKRPTAQTLHHSVFYSHAVKKMEGAAAAYETGSPAQHRAICEAFFKAQDLEPAIIDFIRRQESFSPATRQAALATLSGYADSHLSPERNPRLRGALAEEGVHSVLNAQFIRKLSSATFLALSDMHFGEPYRPGRCGTTGDGKGGRRGRWNCTSTTLGPSVMGIPT